MTMQTTATRRFNDLTDGEVKQLIIEALNQIEKVGFYKHPMGGSFEMEVAYDPERELTPEDIETIRDDKNPLSAYSGIMADLYSDAIEDAEEELLDEIYVYIDSKGYEIDPNQQMKEGCYPGEEIFYSFSDIVGIWAPHNPYYEQVKPILEPHYEQARVA